MKTKNQTKLAESPAPGRKHVLYGIVADKPDVFLRIALILSKRNFSIQFYRLSPNRDANTKKLTLEVKGDGQALPQVLKQIAKLVDVVQIMAVGGSNHV